MCYKNGFLLSKVIIEKMMGCLKDSNKKKPLKGLQIGGILYWPTA